MHLESKVLLQFMQSKQKICTIDYKTYALYRELEFQMCYYIFIFARFKRLSLYYFVASVTVNISQKCYMIFKSMNRHNSKCIDK